MRGIDAMKAFLLAAGLGTRLRPLTNDVPKCLLPIGGKPLLQIWLEQMQSHGVDEVLINTHWLSEKVDDFLKGWNSSRMKVIAFHEPVLLGSAGTLKANERWTADGEPFFILYGDNYTCVNLSEIAAFHREHGLPFTLGIFRTKNPERCGIAELTGDGTVKSFVEKPEVPRTDLAAAGIYVADGRIFDYFPAGVPGPSEPLDLGFHIIPRLVGKMKAYLIRESLLDIGTPEAYEMAQKIRANTGTAVELAGADSAAFA